MAKEKIKAPRINAESLWKMSDIEFNNWRRKNDYPRIIEFLKDRVPRFKDWMEEQKVTDDLMIELTPSNFLRERKNIFIYTVINKDSNEEKTLLSKNYRIGETYFYKNKIIEKQKIIPYLEWYKKNSYSYKKLHMSNSSQSGRSHYFMDELELIDLGACNLKSQFHFGNRFLDFVSLDDLTISNCINNTYLRLWFSSAQNVTVNGDLAFVDCYKTSFYSVWGAKQLGLKLYNGTFQGWSFNDCELNITASNATLSRWNVKSYDLYCTLNHSDIKESVFTNGKIRAGVDIWRAKNLHSHVKRLYSQIGLRKDASRHYFLEKSFERKSYLRIKSNYREEYHYFKNKGKLQLLFLYVKYFLKYLNSLMIDRLWGYGEKPSRIIFVSIIAILLFALTYYLHPNAIPETKCDLINSLSYSIETFLTIGYNDLKQSDPTLKLLSWTESLLGLFFWGILIAGFSNNAKDY